MVFKLFDKALSAVRVGISSIHETVYENPFKPALFCCIEETENMLKRTVDSAP